VAGSALLDRARPLLGELDAAIAATQSVGGELANRMATLWAPVLETASADRDIQEMRAAYEAFHAQSPVPESIEVRPVTAGGVPALVLGAKDDDGPGILYLHGGGYIVGSAYGYRRSAGRWSRPPASARSCRTTGWRPSIRSPPRSRTR
jgi:epsilon-lactone hydrolase